MLKKILGAFSHDIGIDLGTANTLVYVKGKGIIINEPSVVAINKRTGDVLAIGEEAKKMVGRTPGHIIATQPLVAGVVSDFEVTEKMLSYFIEKVHQRTFNLFPKPRVVIGIPSGVTEVEKKAVEDAILSAGAREAFLIEEPMAGAIGARLPVQEAIGNLIVDIGGGTTEIAVISLGGIVVSRSLRIAGDKLNQDIIHFIREEYSLLLGQRTAEEIKIKIGSILPSKENLSTKIRGRDLISGLPKEIEVSPQEIQKALFNSIHLLIENIKSTIEETPPELVADILERGIVLWGGGAMLQGLDRLISSETKVPVHIAEDPMTCVVRGTGIVLEDIEKLKDVLVNP